MQADYHILTQTLSKAEKGALDFQARLSNAAAAEQSLQKQVSELQAEVSRHQNGAQLEAALSKVMSALIASGFGRPQHMATIHRVCCSA